jgi:hypothetical protein
MSATVVESDRDRRFGRRDQVQAGDQMETRNINECDNKRKRKLMYTKKE